MNEISEKIRKETLERLSNIPEGIKITPDQFIDIQIVEII